MALKNTKGTQPPFIAKPSKGTVLRAFIAKRLAESASFLTAKVESSTSFSKSSISETRGERTEREAATWLEKRGDLVVARRFETPFAEVDIIAIRPQTKNRSRSLLICEVKSSFWPDDRGLGLGPRQRARLARAAAWIESETSYDVEIVLLGPSTHSGHFLEIPIF